MLTKLYTAAVSRLTALKSKKGQTLVEYGLILALVSIVVIAVLTLLGDQLKNIFSKITDTLGSQL
jgi:pilus assembly protein Flp/PilA